MKRIITLLIVANICTIASGQGNPIIVAIQKNDPNIEQVIKNNPQYIHQKSNRSPGNTPLHIAVRNGDTETARLLLSYYDHIYQKNPLYLAARYGQIKPAQSLLLPNIKNSSGLTPLHLAAQNGHTEIVQLLLQNNADPNIQDNNGDTPLHFSSENDHTETVQLLLQNNADPNIQNNDDDTPLHIACEGDLTEPENDHIEIVKLLLQNNADPNIQVNNGDTPLHITSNLGHTDIFKLLLQYNADPNIPDNANQTPLHDASLFGFTEIVKLLLQNNVDHNIQANDGNTPLYLASLHENTETVQLLLNYNADPNIQNNNGETPLSIAIYRNNLEIISLILAYNNTKELQQLTAYNKLQELAAYQEIEQAFTGTIPNMQHLSVNQALRIMAGRSYNEAIIKYVRNNKNTLTNEQLTTLLADAVTLNNVELAQNLINSDLIPAKQQAQAFNIVVKLGTQFQQKKFVKIAGKNFEQHTQLLSDQAKEAYKELSAQQRQQQALFEKTEPPQENEPLSDAQAQQQQQGKQKPPFADIGFKFN